jgi:hypothetical protein
VFVSFSDSGRWYHIDTHDTSRHSNRIELRLKKSVEFFGGRLTHHKSDYQIFMAFRCGDRQDESIRDR